jgi:hypothetical protein
MEELQQLEKMNQPISKETRRILLAVVVVVLVIAYFLYRIFVSFEDYEVSNAITKEDAEQTSYMDFMDNLLSYSRDGAFYTDYSGNLIWNETYEMSNPKIEICDDKLLLYDKSGTQALIQSVTGNLGSISTTLPIVEADVAGNGNVAVLMQEGNTGYLNLYSSEGKVLASGEVHTENTGYPISLALSSDGENMMVSLINLNDGDVKSTVVFYNFGSAGDKQENNIVGNFSYSNLVIPEVDYVDGDDAIAFGDNEIIVFSNTKEPKVKTEHFLSGEMKCVFHNDKYYGVVTSSEDGTNTLGVYNMKGKRRFEKAIEDVYTKISFTKTNEVLLTDGEHLTLYTMLGVKKFSYDFTGGIYQIIPWESYRTYIIIEKGKLERIRLK